MMGSLRRETRACIAGGGICSCTFRGWGVFKARVSNLALSFPDGARKGNGWLWCKLTFQVRVLAPRSLLAGDSQTVSQSGPVKLGVEAAMAAVAWILQ